MERLEEHYEASNSCAIVITIGLGNDQWYFFGTGNDLLKLFFVSFSTL